MHDDGQEAVIIERTKLAVDSVKHITTLATGTIILSVPIEDAPGLVET